MVYKSAVQILQQAEELKLKISGKCDLLLDSQPWTMQQKLQTIYQQVLVIDLEYALDKKVEQDLWNIGFKNYITILQGLVRDKKNTRRSDCQALLTWCLEAASGFYISLLQELANTYDIDLPFRRSGRIYGQIREHSSEHISTPQTSSCLYICQYCLVHLGDLARYRNQRKQAENFYKQAIQVSPISGQPYNQLALLEASLGDKLSTVFYYIRGIAVKNPFPAATTNLSNTLNSIDKECTLEKGLTKMNANEFIQVFLKTHGYLYSSSELNMAETMIKSLNAIMTPLVATESFTTDKLVKMTVISLYVFKHVSAGKMNELTEDEIKARNLTLELLASSLSAFLMPVHTLKSDETLLTYYALPAIKILLYWIQSEPTILADNVFAKRLQIWPGFCKLLNQVQIFLKEFSSEKYSKLPLEEDCNLEGFIPLAKYLSELDFRKRDGNPEVHHLLRIHRILDLGKWLADYSANEQQFITRSELDDQYNFEPSSVQPDPTFDLLEEIKSLSFESKSDTSIDKSSERKAGILKPQGSLEKSREERDLFSSSDPNLLLDNMFLSSSPTSNKNEGKMKRAKQNVALQSIFKKMEESKQVKFSVEEKVKDNKSVKFDQNTSTLKAAIPSTATPFNPPLRTQSFNQNHPAFSLSSSQPDYLTSLRKLSNMPGFCGECCQSGCCQNPCAPCYKPPQPCPQMSINGGYPMQLQQDHQQQQHQLQQNSLGNYSLFNNTPNWSPDYSSQQYGIPPMSINPSCNQSPFGNLPQSSYYANDQQGPQSLAQLLEQQNQMPKNDYYNY